MNCMSAIDFYFTNIIFEWIYNQMKRIHSFTNFVNESMMAGITDVYFIFVPVNKNFESLDKSIESSNTPFPSEGIKSGTHGYLLVPVTIENSRFLDSASARPSEGISGNIKFTKNSDEDGFIVMNDIMAGVAGVLPGGSAIKAGLTGRKATSATVDGFGRQKAIYLRSGNALIAEMLMKNLADGEKIQVKDIKYNKISNGFDKNECMFIRFYGGHDEAVEIIKSILAAASDNIGISINDPEILKKYDSTEILYDFFKTNPGEFMSMNFSAGVFEKVSDLAKEKEPEKNVSQTIDNLKDLKSSGLFDD
jgi:hypothetical protein